MFEIFMTDYSFFSSTTPAGVPIFKITRTGEPSGGQDVGWYFSPEIKDIRTFLNQKNHTTPTEVRTSGVYSEYFERIESEDGGEFRYSHRDFRQNGKFVLQQGDDALRWGVANHNGSHPYYTEFVTARVDEIILRGLDVVEAETARLVSEGRSISEAQQLAEARATEFMAREHRGLNKFLEMAIQEGGLRNDGGGDGSDGKPLLIFSDNDPRVKAGLIDSAANHNAAARAEWTMDRIAGEFDGAGNYTTEPTEVFQAGVEGKELSYDRLYVNADGHYGIPTDTFDTPDPDLALMRAAENIARDQIVSSVERPKGMTDQEYFGKVTDYLKSPEFDKFQSTVLEIISNKKLFPTLGDVPNNFTFLVRFVGDEGKMEQYLGREAAKAAHQKLLADFASVDPDAMGAAVKRTGFWADENGSIDANGVYKLSTGALSLAATSLFIETKWRAETKETGQSFVDWMGEKTPDFLSSAIYNSVNVALIAGSILAVSRAGGLLGTVVGGAVSITLGSSVLYVEFKEYLRNYITAFSGNPDYPDVEDKREMLSDLDNLEKIIPLEAIAKAILKPVSVLPTTVFGMKTPPPVFEASYEDEIILTEQQGEAWLWGHDAAYMEGNTLDNVIFHNGYGTAVGGEGDDTLIGWRGKTLDRGELVGRYARKGVVLDDVRLEAEKDMSLVLKGGDGDDWLVAVLGEKVVTIGGTGRDWIFNTSRGGVIYGDTYSTTTKYTDELGILREEPVDQTDYDNSDKIWFYSGVTMMDPGESDYLTLLGMPLVGGTSGVPLWANLRIGGPFRGEIGMIGDGGLSGIYFDDTIPWIAYYYDEAKDRLEVVNIATFALARFSKIFATFGDFPVPPPVYGPDGEPIRDGAMVFENYDNFSGSIFGWGLFEVGDLSMSFKQPNFSVFLALETLANIAGTTSVGYAASQGLQHIPFLDMIATTVAWAVKLAKNVTWAAHEDPLIIDLDGDGIETLSRAEAGVFFDVDGDFFKESTGWLSSDDGFLALDKDGNGRISDIDELFGNVGLSGVDELAQYDLNGDGLIDVQDAVYAELQVWQDYDQDGETDEGELSSLEDLGIVTIELGKNPLNVTTPQGTTLDSYIRVHFADSIVTTAYDAVFELSNMLTEFSGEGGTASWLRNDGLIEMPGIGNVVDLAVAQSNDFELAEITGRDAALMTVPELEAMRALSSDTLTAWGMVLETSRELTPVLIRTDANGVTLADRGVYVEDGQGGYWTLASGAEILDSQGQPIARATLEDVLAQATAAEESWTLEQAFSPSSRGEALEHREEAPYLAQVVDGRVLVHDYGIQNEDGSWRLASGADVLAQDGSVIAEPARVDILAQTAAEGLEWRSEDLQFSPLANLPVEQIGVYVVDGTAVDYTVQVTDADGSFYVWARNLDRALELQYKTGDARDFNLRNYAVDLETLDEAGSTDDSSYRVELLTPGQFNFALATTAGIEFRPAMLTADVDSGTGIINYSVDDSGNISLSDIAYESGVKAMIPMIDLMLDTWVATSRGAAVRMALQGGMQNFARGLAFDGETNKFHGTTGRELAPMFEAIFEAAPTGYDAAFDYLSHWNQILSYVLADYTVDGSGNLGGAGVAIDQKFVMQMLLPAYELVGIDMDLRAVMNTLRIDETLLVDHAAGDTEVAGTGRGDFIYLSGGDQVYRGGSGADVYFVGAEFGNDVIEDVDLTEGDELRFSHISSEDVIAVRDGNDLILSAEGQNGTLTVLNHFLGDLNPYIAGKQQTTHMSSIVFADGVVWDPFLIAMAVANPRDTDDVVVGSADTDVMIGGKGNDVMIGGLGDDIYIYRPGDGVDIYRERESGVEAADFRKGGFDNIMFLGDVGADDVRLTRAGESTDLVITLLDEDGTATGDRITIEGQFDGMRWNLKGILGLFDNQTGSKLNDEFDFDFIGPSIIEQLTFEDGSSINFEEMTKRILENARTDGEDPIYGFLTADTLDGGAGNDLLTGRGGGDTYQYGTGYGLDVIRDDDYDSFGLFGSPADRLVLLNDLRWTDFEFERDGASDTLFLRLENTQEGVILEDFLFRNRPKFMDTNLIEEIEFGDGTVWSWTKFLQAFIDAKSTSGDDVLYGYMEKGTSDLLDGGAGNDILSGFGGNDTYIYAEGYGDDTLSDTGGNDRLHLDGLRVEDVDFLRAGTDLIFEVKATGERVTLQGQYDRSDAQSKAIEFFDFEDGDGLADTHFTVSFVDRNPEDVDVVGTAADEELRGSDFSETLDGKGGNDTLIGGSDGDTYKFDAGYGQDVIEDTQVQTAWEGRQGLEVETADRILFGADITTSNIEFAKDGDDLLITIAGRTDSLRVRNQFRDTSDGVEYYEFDDGTLWHISDIEEHLQIVGGNRGDNIILGVIDQPNVLDGRQGDDQLFGGTEADTYTFGAGYDFDTITEQAETGNGAVDRVVFGAAVTLDTLVLRRNGDDLIIDLGNATDVLTIAGGLATTPVEEFHFASGDVLTLDQIKSRMVQGTDGNDQLTGFDDRDDDLAGGAGTDELRGGMGNDTYRFGFGDGRDAITETGGIDRVEFGAGVTRDQITFEELNGDLIIRLALDGDILAIAGGAGADAANWVETFVFSDGEELSLETLRSELLIDSFNEFDSDVDATGIDGQTDITPGRGSDVVRMGADTQFVFAKGDGQDTVVVDETPASAAITMSGFLETEVEVRRAGPFSNDLLLASQETGDQVLLRNVLLADSWPVIRFSGGGEWQLADLLQAYVDGQPSERADLITGGSGDELLRGGEGDDDLQGGAGSDTYVFQRGDGKDIIADSSGSQDVLEIYGYLPGDITVSRVTETRQEIVLTFAGTEDQITLRFLNDAGVETVRFSDGTSWSKADLFAMSIGQATEFADTLAGSDGDDVLNGLGGDDRLEGGLGDDTYVVEFAQGNDVIVDSGAAANADRLLLREALPGQVVALREGTSLLIMLPGGGSVTVLNQFASNGEGRIEFIEFSDKTVWDFDTLSARVIADAKANGGTVYGTTAHEDYFHSLGDGSYTIEDHDNHTQSSYRTDSLTFIDVASTDVVVESDGQDVVIRITANGEEIRITNYFNANGARFYNAIETVTFTDVSYDIEGLAARAVADEKASGTVTGTLAFEAYSHSLGDGSYTIEDTDSHFTAAYRTDSLTFTDVASTDVVVESDGQDAVIRITANGEEIRILNYFNANGARFYNAIETVTFTDVSFDIEGLAARAVADEKATGTVTGTLAFEAYSYSLGDGSYTIEDYDSYYSTAAYRTDSLTFTDVASTDVVVESDGQDAVIRITANGEEIRILNYFNANGAQFYNAIETVTFTDVSYDIEGLAARAVADEKASGTVTGTLAFEAYSHSLGDGSYTIEDYDSHFTATYRTDSLTFTDTLFADTEVVRDGNFLVFRLSNGEEVRISRGTERNYAVETFIFSDGETKSYSEFADAPFAGTEDGEALNGLDGDDSVYARGGNDTLDGGSGDDTILGGAGDDVLLGNSGEDSFDGGEGQDTLDFSYANQDVTIDLAGGQAIADSGNAESVSGIEHVIAGGGDDVLTGSADPNMLSGGSGDDQITGGAGDDTLLGGAGSDTLDGGTGADVFVMDLPSAAGTIIDRGASGEVDRLELRGVKPGEAMLFQVGADLQIRLLQGGVITVVNQFSGDPLDQIEILAFGDGSEWTSSEIAAVTAAGYKTDTGFVEGTSQADNFTHAKGDGFYQINNAQGSSADRLTFTDVRSDEVRFLSPNGDDLQIVLDNGETVTVRAQLESGGHYAIEEFQFLDTVFDAAAVHARALNDMKSTGKVYGSDIAETYVHRLGDGSYSIEGHASDTVFDRLHFADVNPGQVAFAHVGDDLTITLTNGEVITVTRHFDSLYWALEEVSFADDTVLSGKALRDRVVADMKATGSVTGSEFDDTFVHHSGDGSYAIEDRGYGSYTDRLHFADVNPDQVTFAHVGDDLTITLTNGEVITVSKHFDDELQAVEEVSFADDTVLSGKALRDRVVADMKATGSVTGSEDDDTYVHHSGDGSYTIEDRGYGSYTDRLHFADVNPDQVTFAHVGDDLTITLGNGEVVTVSKHFNDELQAVEEVSFAENTVLSGKALRDRVVADMKATGSVVGSGDGEDFYHAKGDGSYSISDYDAGNSSMDRLNLTGINPNEVTLARNGDNLLLRLDNGEEIELVQYLGSSPHRILDEIVFADGTVWTNTEAEARLATDEFTDVPGTDAADVLNGNSGRDRIEGGLGDDIVSGGWGDDTYVFSKGDGKDRITENGDGFDTVEISGYVLEDLQFSRDGRNGSDLLIRFVGSADEIRIIGGLLPGADQVEQIRIAADGDVLDIHAVKDRLVTGSASAEDDMIIGTDAANELEGGTGNDLIDGQAGADRYTYRDGDGDDRILDSGNDAADVLYLPDLTPEQVRSVQRTGEDGLDLILYFEQQRDRVILVQALASGNSGIDRIEFSEGTVWAKADLRAKAIEYAETEQADQVNGFDGDDVFAGSAGDDLLSGGDGADTYYVTRTSGSNRISESSADSGADKVVFMDFVSSEVSAVRLFKGSDTVVISFATSHQTLTVENALAADGSGIEEYHFSDMVVWTKADLLAVTQNTAPEAVDDGYYTAVSGEDYLIRASELLVNDYDPDGNPLILIAVNGGANGTAEINENGDIIYRANDGFTGPAAFTYTVSDGQNGISTASVDIRVRPATAAKNDSGFTVAEDDVLTIEAERLLSNDADGDRMVVGQVFGAQNGTVSLNSQGQITFTPDANFNGTAQFTYAANTPEGGRAEAVVYVEVTPVNDAPAALEDSGYQTVENQPFLIPVSELLANDTDIDGDNLSVSSVTGNENVTVTVTDDGYVQVTPADYFFGTAYFDYTADDGNGGTATGRVSFYVEPVNTAPDPQADSLSMQEDEILLISAADLLANDLEHDGDPLVITEVSSGIGGSVRLLDNQTVEFTAAPDFHGEGSFEYTVDDGQGGSASVQVTVNIAPVNDAPLAVADRWQQMPGLHGSEDNYIDILISDLLANDSDAEGSTLYFAGLSDALNGEVVQIDSETLRFTPAQDYWGEASFNYLIRDEEGVTNSAKVTLYFDNVGDAPPVAGDDIVYVTEDVQTTIPASVLLANDTDIDLDDLQIISLSFNDVALNGTVVLDESGNIVFTPDLNFEGSGTFRYTVSDNADGTDTGEVTVVMIPVNDDPEIADDTFDPAPYNTPWVIRVADLLANDGDVDVDDEISFRAIETLSNGQAELYGDDFIIVRNPRGFTGPVTLEYSIEDLDAAYDTGFATGGVSGNYSQQQTGSSLRDLLIGNDLDETISGFADNDDIFVHGGNNTAFGGDGDDKIFAEGGSDSLDGGSGNDTIEAGAGDDAIRGGDGGDTIDGGEGFDVVSFEGSNSSVRAGLDTRLGQGGHAAGDLYSGVEGLLGSAFGDTLSGDETGNLLRGMGGSDSLTGNGGADTLEGGQGNDTISGGAGGDQLDGGDGSDTADYSASAAAVSVSLLNGTAAGGDAEGDTLEAIENLTGSDHADAALLRKSVDRQASPFPGRTYPTGSVTGMPRAV